MSEKESDKMSAKEIDSEESYKEYLSQHAEEIVEKMEKDSREDPDAHQYVSRVVDDIGLLNSDIPSVWGCIIYDWGVEVREWGHFAHGGSMRDGFYNMIHLQVREDLLAEVKSLSNN